MAHQQILHSDHGEAPAPTTGLVLGQVPMDEDECTISASSFPDVLEAAATILDSNGPRHAISTTMLAHVATAAMDIPFVAPETASEKGEKFSIEFVVKALSYGSVSYRHLFDEAAKVVRMVAEAYSLYSVEDRAEFDLMVRAHTHTWSSTPSPSRCPNASLRSSRSPLPRSRRGRTR